MKRALCICLALALALCLAPIVRAESEYPDELSIFCPLSDHISKVGLTNNGETMLFQEVERITGTKVKWIHPAAGTDMSAQINLIVASSQLPDIIVRPNWKSASNGLSTWHQDGIILDLTELIPEYMPNYYAMLTEQEYGLANVMVDGRMYYITGFDHGLPSNYIIARYDWLNEFDLEPPRTIDDLESLLEYCAQNDMDGDGELGDVWPLSAQAFTDGASGLYKLLWPWGITAGFMQIDNNVTYGPLEEEFEEAMAFIRGLYEKGYIDPDYSTQDWDTLCGKMMNDQAFIQPNYQTNKISSAMAAAGDEDYYATGIPILRLNENSPPYVFSMMYISRDNSSSDTVITTSCKEPEKALRWLDYAYSTEGNLLFNWGIEGESFIYDENGGYQRVMTGARERLGKYDNLTDLELSYLYSFSGQAVFPMSTDISYAIGSRHKYAAEAMLRWASDFDASRTLPEVPFTSEESDAINDKMADINTYMQIQYDKLVTGETPITEIPAMREKLYAMGIEECISVYQQAYDRYLGK